LLTDMMALYAVNERTLLLGTSLGERKRKLEWTRVSAMRAWP
jgi:hypothetical protein